MTSQYKTLSSKRPSPRKDLRHSTYLPRLHPRPQKFTNPTKRLLRLPHLFLQYLPIQHPQQRVLSSPNIDRQQDTKPLTIIIQQPIIPLSLPNTFRYSPVSTNHINRRCQIPMASLPSCLISLFVNLVWDFKLYNSLQHTPPRIS